MVGWTRLDKVSLERGLKCVEALKSEWEAR